MLDLLNEVDRFERQIARTLPPTPATSPTNAPTFLAFAQARGLEPTRPVVTLADIVERSRREEVRAVISMPPRHGKTETILHGFAWLLAHDPHRTHAFATYAAQLARSKSRKARRLAAEAGVTLAGDSKSVEEWRTTTGGGLLATGVGGPLTGQGITGLGVVDDPLKNRQEAESSLIRERIWEWFTDVFYTRLEPGASALVVATRWHPDDLSGRLIADGWQLINLPALADGEALWPDRYPPDRLEQIRNQVGEYTWASLYQGEPRPRGGAVFKEPRYYDRLPDGGYKAGCGVDWAYTAKSHADYSVALEGRLYGDTLYLTRMVRLQAEAPVFAQHLKTVEARRVTSFMSGTEKALEQFIKRDLGVTVQRLNANQDKFMRAQPVAAAWNDGKVLLPSGQAWVGELLDEVLGFTGVNDAHDDIVDALAGLWAGLNTSPQIFFV